MAPFCLASWIPESKKKINQNINFEPPHYPNLTACYAAMLRTIKVQHHKISCTFGINLNHYLFVCLPVWGHFASCQNREETRAESCLVNCVCCLSNGVHNQLILKLGQKIDNGK